MTAPPNRIAALPRRVWRDRAAVAVPALTAALRTPNGAQTLFPGQAVSLLELWECRGLACIGMRVGSGKTIVLGLAPTVMASLGYTRPLIVVPGALRAKTERDLEAARADWQVAPQYWLESYTSLAQVKRADFFQEHQPDLLLFDEPKALRRIQDGSVPRRIGRYVHARRAAGLPICCAFFTGTPDRDSLLDYAHILEWALGTGSPLPLDAREAAAWAAYIDQGDSSGRMAFDKYLPGPEDTAVDRYCERLIQTPGVLFSDDTFDGAALNVTVQAHNPGLDAEFERLREEWIRPDGWDLATAAEDRATDEVNTWSIWDVARQLALGFYYRADPVPPKDWMTARRAWVNYVRDMIQAGDRYDTMKQVELACERAAKPVIVWETWKRLKDTFEPGRVPVWLSDHALQYAARWGATRPGIVWVDHLAFGARLSEITGWPFYGQKGETAAGVYIESESGARTIIASRKANQEGRNLQYAFHRNLIMAMPNAAADVEQLFGRTHRFGQRQPFVDVEIFCACTEHVKALQRVIKGANSAQRRHGMTQKALASDFAIQGQRPVDAWAWR